MVVKIHKGEKTPEWHFWHVRSRNFNAKHYQFVPEMHLIY